MSIEMNSNRSREGAVEAKCAQSRYLGIDVGAETIKLVELVKQKESLTWTRRKILEHGKNISATLRKALEEWDWDSFQGASVSGRLSRQVNLQRIPTKQAQSWGFRFLFDDKPATIVSIGSHGFSVLEIRGSGTEVFRENSRCSQGTGNFLRQLVERFSVTVEEASDMTADVEKASMLSGRCPVILKTDMTHLANRGESRAQILAGLYDAVCENVLALLKPGISPNRVVLIGGLSRSARVQRTFKQSLAMRQMILHPTDEDDALFFEALGCGIMATRCPEGMPSLDELMKPAIETSLERVPALARYLSRVRRMPHQPAAHQPLNNNDLVIGLDIGSTGSKAVALNPESNQMVWEAYARTLGDPVNAAQSLLLQFVKQNQGRRVASFGVTGSGREIVGSLLTTCYGANAVFILNEIAAHARGALYYDSRVDTIFEIGGQDAKYIQLVQGRVVDCAMNEACSAGTGSFIEEQGNKFCGIHDVEHLGSEALAANHGVSLGQHCSVFMAEIIDEAVAAGVDQKAIVAGLYDSIIQNYLNRVKGNRPVGKVVFCQGMPFTSDALAAAVARQTGSEIIIPPNPGTVGALGIALLAADEIPQKTSTVLDPKLFLEARIESRQNFVCHSVVGCGEPGNRCKIDCLKTVVEGKYQRFNWGGNCALYDKGTRRRKLPDLAPDPFREREQWINRLIATGLVKPVKGRIAMTQEFSLTGLFPFFAVFFRQLGFSLAMPASADQSVLKRGIQQANVPYCAPMQLFHGIASLMAAEDVDYIFLPMICGLPRQADESHAITCPIVQASPDILKWDLGETNRKRILSPVIQFGRNNLDSPEFLESCRILAVGLGVDEDMFRAAHAAAKAVQDEFENECRRFGKKALDFCIQHSVTPIVVLGRPYTLYNKVLNSNVPAILREQGALPIPGDCYPLEEDAPVFEKMYWGHGQRILRAAHQIRRTPSLYAVYCSNYSCGPDSFNLHFFADIMEGKPFAIIETDGHSGDAGTKTRMEAFLYCVSEDIRRRHSATSTHDFSEISRPPFSIMDVRRTGERLLIPWMGPASLSLAACFRSIGLAAEGLPMPDAESIRLGRKNTSGKECLPMAVTLGNLLKAVQQNDTQRFVFLMPSTNGPCRFGIYNLLYQIVLSRQQLSNRVRIWSPNATGYFKDLPPALSLIIYAGCIASDVLYEALLDVRPVETAPGAAQAIYHRFFNELMAMIEAIPTSDYSLPDALWQVTCGGMFGIADLLVRASRAFADAKGQGTMPTVLLVGEIYVRCDPASNDFVIDKLEARGFRVRLAVFNEWLEYVDLCNRQNPGGLTLKSRFSSWIQDRIRHRIHSIMAQRLGWPERARVVQMIDAAKPYLRDKLRGEAVLTLGGPLLEWRRQHIDAAVSVGPLECMPNKIAEAQFFHIAECEGLPTLTLSLNGDAIDPATLDNFAYEVHSRFQARRQNLHTRDRILHFQKADTIRASK